MNENDLANLISNFGSSHLGAESASVGDVKKTELSVLDLPIASDLSIHSAMPTNQLESSNGDFEQMVKDLRSTFVFWLKKTQQRLKSQCDAIEKENERLAHDKATFVQRVKIEQEAAMAKIEAQQARHNAEMAAQLKQVQVEREESRKRIQEERQELLREKELFQNYMQLETHQLKNRIQLFEQDMQKISDSKIATQTMVDINVGGVVFETSRQVLARQPDSFLASLLSGRHDVGRDRQGRIFLDRDYELFRVILNFLRNPTCIPVPRDTNESSLILTEALYYRIKFSPYPLLMCMGGHDGNGHLKSVEFLDPENQCWRRCGDLATERAYFGAGVVGNFVYVFGGHNLDYKALRETEMYDRLRDSWYTAAPLCQARRNNAGIVLNDMLYCVGGFDGVDILDSVECFDPRMKNWISVAPMHSCRSSPMVAHQNGLLYVMGGTCGERLKTIERYDPRMDKWEMLSNELNQVRSAGSACTFQNEIYICGGMDNVHNIHSSMERFSSSSQSAFCCKGAPISFVDGTLTRNGDVLMLLGGQSTQVSSDVYSYKPQSDEWQQGPSLLTRRYGHCTVLLDI